MPGDDHHEIYERLRLLEREQAVQGERLVQLVKITEALAASVQPLAAALNKGRGAVGVFWIVWSVVPAASGALLGYWLRG